jgi:PIN domain nuclease of toxin-antitoxin system
VKLLLDTHAFVWSALAPERLSARVTSALQDLGNQVLVSAASVYEIDYKRSFDAALQRMPLDLNDAVATQGFTWLDVSWRQMRQAARLPLHHRDPWDRILIGQALLEDAILVTADRRIALYGLPTLM